MANYWGELGDEGEVALLASRNRVGAPVEGSNQGLVVCKDDKTPSLKHVTVVANCGHHRQELAVEGAVADLGLIQLCRKES